MDKNMETCRVDYGDMSSGLWNRQWINIWVNEWIHTNLSSSVQSLSRVQLFATPMNPSTPGLPVHHQLPESTQTHVHWVSDAIQPSHSLSSPSPPALNLSQHQGLFKWVSSSHQVAKVLEFQLQRPMNTQDWSPLGWTGWISLQSKGHEELEMYFKSENAGSGWVWDTFHHLPNLFLLPHPFFLPRRNSKIIHMKFTFLVFSK